MTKSIHVVWSPVLGPIAAYNTPEMAWAHARSMLGVDVASLFVALVLPEIVREDLRSEYDGFDEVTPADIIAVEDSNDP